MWIGESLSTLENLSIQSFLKNGHAFHLYAYDTISNIPDGVVIKDANDILPSENIFFDSKQTIASFSDWFRYKLLFVKGGWWVDLDVICLKPFNIRSSYCFSTEKTSINGQTIITNGILKSPAKALFLLEMLTYIENVVAERKSIEFGEFGPILIHAVVSTYDCDRYIKPIESFCPVMWYELEKLITDTSFSVTNNMFAIHMWNQIWKRMSLNKNARYPTGSMYERLKARYAT